MTDHVHAETWFDLAATKRLRTAYELAVRHNHEAFQFDGQPLLVGYAKYLLEYLEAQLKEPS